MKSKFLKALCLGFIFLKSFFTSHEIKSQEEKIIYMVLETGLVKIQTYPEFAPKTVKRII